MARRESMLRVVDRFSNLPIEIAHLVSSHLTFKDLIRVSCVSKRCREIYMSTPYLNFHDFPDMDMTSCELRKRVLDSMHRFFVQRGVDHKIQCFRFRWGDTDEETKYFCRYNAGKVYDGHEENLQLRLLEWVGYALKCNVEVLHLVITSNYPFEKLPASLFRCGSLKSLLLDMNCPIDVPTMDLSSNLEYLRLKYVSIVDEGFLKWISCCCRCIKELFLVEVSGLKNLVMESSSLESLIYESHLFVSLNRKVKMNVNISCERLEKLHIIWSVGMTDRSVNIAAPNLKYLEWFGEFTSRHNLGELMCLEKAEISSASSCCIYNVLFDFLCSIRKAKVLILNMPIIQCLGLNIDSWKLQDLPFICEAKEVVIHLYDGPHVFEFASYILENAQHLEKMTMYYDFQGSAYQAAMKLRKVVKLKRNRITNTAVFFHKVTNRNFGVVLELVGSLDPFV